MTMPAWKLRDARRTTDDGRQAAKGREKAMFLKRQNSWVFAMFLVFLVVFLDVFWCFCDVLGSSWCFWWSFLMCFGCFCDVFGVFGGSS